MVRRVWVRSRRLLMFVIVCGRVLMVCRLGVMRVGLLIRLVLCRKVCCCVMVGFTGTLVVMGRRL